MGRKRDPPEGGRNFLLLTGPPKTTGIGDVSSFISVSSGHLREGKGGKIKRHPCVGHLSEAALQGTSWSFKEHQMSVSRPFSQGLHRTTPRPRAGGSLETGPMAGRQCRLTQSLQVCVCVYVCIFVQLRLLFSVCVRLSSVSRRGWSRQGL